MKAFIFAAGMGTRLKPLTDSIPKALVPVDGVPMLEILLIKLKRAGFTEVIINVHHFADQIEDFLRAKGNFGMQITCSDERACLLDTGGALKQARPLIGRDEPLLIHNVDILSNVDLRALYTQHLENRCAATLLVSQRDTQRYLLFDQEDRLTGWHNIATGEIKTIYNPQEVIHDRHLAFSGIHVVSPEVLDAMENWPTVFSITPFYLQSCKQLCIKGTQVDHLRMMDIGKVDSLNQAAAFLNTLA